MIRSDLEMRAVPVAMIALGAVMTLVGCTSTRPPKNTIALTSPCEDPLPRPEYLDAERWLSDEPDAAIADFETTPLAESVKSFYDSWVAGDIDRIVDQQMQLGDDIEAIRRSDWARHLSTYRILSFKILAARRDNTNPLHVQVLASVVARGSWGCFEDASVTDWILLYGKWRFLPIGAMIVT
jgi:hypothetical protein